MHNVIKLTDKFYATCPECGSQQFLLPVNGPGTQWDKIVGTECANCEYFMEWIIVEGGPNDN
jgi:RNA polymerase subunit RPABC4/transcription elongation factor Spt4